MNKNNQPITYEGGCHCGAVRFKVIIDRDEVYNCNCSICRKKGFLHLIVPPENFTLLRGNDSLITYTFNTHIAQHTFCKICGIHPFYRSRSHPEAFDVNLRCLDQDLLSQFKVIPFDGANWEKMCIRLEDSYQVLITNF